MSDDPKTPAQLADEARAARRAALPRLPVSNLADLAPEQVNVEVEAPGDLILVLAVQLPTMAQYNRILRSVPLPVAPIAGVDPLTKRPLQDFNNPDYARQMEERREEQNFRLLGDCLRLDDLPGGSLEDRAAAVKASIGAGTARQLLDLLHGYLLKGDAAIQARAETFHGHGAGGAADLHPAGHPQPQ